MTILERLYQLATVRPYSASFWQLFRNCWAHILCLWEEVDNNVHVEGELKGSVLTITNE